MVPVQALVHVAVRVSGQAVLTMPLMVPLADLLGFSRQVPVLAYQVGGGLMELFSPTNGAIMAILLAQSVPYERWLRFASMAIIIPLARGTCRNRGGGLVGDLRCGLKFELVQKEFGTASRTEFA
jgi:uncharacterized ion transporter superfamily protein YfcC